MILAFLFIFVHFGLALHVYIYTCISYRSNKTNKIVTAEQNSDVGPWPPGQLGLLAVALVDTVKVKPCAFVKSLLHHG